MGDMREPKTTQPAAGAAGPAPSPALAWRGKAIGLLDLDAFFASVEQLDHPEWRGKPVIVGGSANKRGVVSTASYEARKFGVHSAMPSAQAERLCPQAIWTQGHFDRYRALSAQVMAILMDETPYVEQVSIDEAFFDVTPGRYSAESPVEICQRIQARVRELGVTCSIGLGTNKTVAKIASEKEKPRGFTVVWPGCEATFLAPLPVKAMSGIGQASASRLATMGIKTLGQLARADVRRMEAEFGVVGPRMVLRAQGREESAVASAWEPDDTKSVSNERTFTEDLLDRRDIEAAIWHVGTLCGRRLRKKGLAGTTLTLKIKYDACHGKTAQTRLGAPTDDERVFCPKAIELLDQIWSTGMTVRLVGVGLSHFDAPAVQQMALFGDIDDAGKTAAAPKRDTSGLSKATDKIRERFGEGAVSQGRELRFSEKTSDTAPQNKD